MSVKSGKTVIANNKKAFHDYEVMETYEAGLVLQGPEVKSLRAGQCQLKGNFVHEWHGDLWVEGVHISPYRFATYERPDPLRKRKLLLKKKEIAKIVSQLKQKGMSCVLLEIYTVHGLMKGLIGIVRGKKVHDKRAVLRQKEQDRTIARSLKAFAQR